MSKSLTLKPRVSEKSYALSQQSNTYAFDVPLAANKLTIKSAVQAQYDVVVTSVKTTIIDGKRKRTVRKNGRAVIGRRGNVKKAYVTLAEGQSLPVFAAIDEAARQQQEVEQKAAKKAAKAAAKEEKK